MNNTRPDYDAVIIGGGIHGAGAAQACAAAGYRCLLVEKNNWGAATSSKSSKLLHGGLRYLQTGQLKLVYECLHERERLLRYAPKLAHINWFYIPVYRQTRFRPWKILAGLSLYRLLSGDWFGHGAFRIIRKRDWQHLHGLDTRDLQAVFAYQDAQTDDRLLTMAVKNSARSLGTDCWSAAEFISATRHDNGYTCTIQHEARLKQISSTMVINATGPWVNDTIERCNSSQQLPMECVQGTHLVLEQQISDACFYLEAPQDGRAIFVLPWYGKTLLGTTETAFHDTPDNTRPTQTEIDYLLDTLRHYFPQADTRIEQAFSGLRVLPQDNHRAFTRSRDTRYLDDHGLLSLYGGKLTAYRATCEKLLPWLQQYCGKRTAVADTRTLPLYFPEDATSADIARDQSR
ncbi:MAG TPA: FAD-dependent oxidoreductase [Pseudomonadales bacterium]|nr:FAD-dependent oxidoreductase [Pseudomonadales bacterium]